jgi:transposase-like protein
MLSNSFKWKHYEGEIILLNARWYLKYPLSYRNLKGMIIEGGIQVDHSTIMSKIVSKSILDLLIRP